MPFYDSKPGEPVIEERRWIIAGGVALAFIAGYVNVIVLGFFHVPVSHMSGAASRIGVDAFSRNLGDLKLIGAIMGGFFAGATLSGLVIGRSQLRPGRRYGAILCAEGIVLAISTLLLRAGHGAGVAAAALACGLQNAMASSYYGLVIRTTHVTGIVTDLGIMTGHWIRGHGVRPWRAILLASVLAGFVAGGVAGAALSAFQGVSALGLASLACFSVGAGYSGLMHVYRMKAAG